MRHILFSAFLTLSLLSSSLFADAQDFAQGTFSLGGKISLNMGATDLKNTGTVGFGFDGLLDVGYFPLDSIKLSFLIGGSTPFTPASRLDKSFTAGFGVTYIWNIGSIFFPYLGLPVRGTWVIEGNRIADSLAGWSIAIAPDVGVYLSLTSNVALKLGLENRFVFPLSTTVNANNTAKWFGALGFLGVEVYL